MVLLSLLLGLMPASTVKNRLLSLTNRNWAIARTAVIQPCIFWRVRHLQVGPFAIIGAANVFRGIQRFEFGAYSELGQFNWLTGTAHFVQQADGTRPGVLAIGEHVGITSRHYIDCSGGVSIGALSTLGGVRSTILTRGLDVQGSRQIAQSVTIGERCLITACVVITPGSTIADRCVVAAGSVVAKDLPDPLTLYAGVPARPVRTIAGGAYFDRTEGHVP